MIADALMLHNKQVMHIPLHNQVIPWAMRKNVTVVHRADNRLEVQWVESTSGMKQCKGSDTEERPAFFLPCSNIGPWLPLSFAACCKRFSSCWWWR